MSDDTVIPFRPRDPALWSGELARSPSNNAVYQTVANALIILLNDECLRGMVSYNQFSHMLTITVEPPRATSGALAVPGPYPRPLEDHDITLIQAYMQRKYGLRVGNAIAREAISTASINFQVHHVRDYLCGLKWDGKPRLHEWLDLAFGCPADRYHEAVGIKFMCAAVKRIMHPGAKFDNVLILEGLQGIGKSRACRALFGEWFTDNIGIDLTNKDTQLALAGVWGAELAEIAALVRGDPSTVKDFFSRQVDYYRPPYGRGMVQRPRQCVFIASTNEDEYLNDPTGNRRFWPVRCRKAEPEWIAEVRDQLWSEAVDMLREQPNMPLYLDDDEVRADAEKQQSERMQADVWTDPIIEWLASQSSNQRITIYHVLRDALQVPKERVTRSMQMRVAGTLKQLGYTKNHGAVDGRIVSYWLNNR